MSEENISVYLTDDELKEQIEEITEKEEISKSEFMRRAAKEYLDSKNEENQRINDLERRIEELESEVSKPIWKQIL